MQKLPNKIGDWGMKYDIARAILSEAIEQIDELSKGTYGSYIKRAAANIDYEKTDTNPENEESVEKKVRRRLKGIGRAVKALGGQHRGAGNKRKQIDEADGNPAPYGYHVKKSPSGRKRYIPKTREDFDSERKKFFAKRPGGEGAYWAEINRKQKAANHANRGEIAEAIEQIDEASNLRRRMSRAYHHMASLLRRAGATPEEVRQGITGRRTPAAKSGRALLVKAMNDSRRKEAKNMPNYPYGRKGPTE